MGCPHLMGDPSERLRFRRWWVWQILLDLERSEPEMEATSRDLLGIVVQPLDLHLVNVGSIPTGPTHGEGRLQPHPGAVLKSTPKVRQSPRSGLNLEGRLSDPQIFLTSIPSYLIVFEITMACLQRSGPRLFLHHPDGSYKRFSIFQRSTPSLLLPTPSDRNSKPHKSFRPSDIKIGRIWMKWRPEILAPIVKGLRAAGLGCSRLISAAD